MENDKSVSVENQRLKSQIAALEQRLEVYEKSVPEKTDELYAEIAERKQAEETIRRISTIQNLILENSTLGIALVRNRIFEWVNARLGELLMLPLEQIQGSSTRVIYPSDEVYEELGKIGYQNLSKKGERSDNVLQLQRSDGTLFWCRFIGRAINPANPQDGSIWMFEDITERKQAEEELKEKDKFVESIVQCSAVATFVVNPEHKVIYWNKACEDLTGIKSEDLLGTSDHWKAFYDRPRSCVADIIIDDKINEMSDLYPVYTRSVLIPDGIHAEGWYPNLGGKNRYIVFDAAPIRDNHERISAAIETLQDITERKQAEERLSKEVGLKNFLIDLYKKAPTLADFELYGYVLDYVVRVSGSTIGFFHFVSDDQKNIIMTTWNAEALKGCTASYATHYPLEQAGNWVDCVRLKRPVIYNNFPDSPHQKGFPEGHPPVRRFLSVPVVEGDKVRLIFGVGNKSEDYDEYDILPVQLLANDLQKIIGQRRVEEALSRSEMHFRSLIENSTDMITILDADGTIVYDSPTIKRILGYEPAELIGQNVFEFIHPDDLPAVRKAFSSTVQNPGAIISTEHRFRYNDGSWRILESVGQNLLENGAVKGIVINSRDVTEYNDESWRILESVGHNLLENGAVKGIVMNSRDITERKKIQAELQKKNLELVCAYEELGKKQALIVQQEKMASIGMLAAGIAHEIKNPLTIILQGVDYLQTAVTDDSLMIEVVERMNKAVRRADIIIKSLISYSRQNSLFLTAQEIPALIDESLVLMENEFRKKNLQVIKQYAPDLPKVTVDGNQIKQVFINVLLNGSDAMSQDGIFTISVRQIEDDGGRKLLEISIKDTGPGIPADKIHEIFDPFYTTKGVSNTGLGLYICRGIIDKHKGIIHAESENGQGANFIIELPVSRET